MLCCPLYCVLICCHLIPQPILISPPIRKQKQILAIGRGSDGIWSLKTGNDPGQIEQAEKFFLLDENSRISKDGVAVDEPLVSHLYAISFLNDLAESSSRTVDIISGKQLVSFKANKQNEY